MDRANNNKISKEDFLKLNEDGSTFIIKQGNKFIMYRVDGWMYRHRDLKENEYISLDDAKKQFTKWYDAWKNGNKEDYKGKYKYLYMGFGNF